MLVIAQNLNASDPDIHAALAAGDRGWIEDLVRRLAGCPITSIDVNAGTFLSSEGAVLDWLAEVVEAVTDLPLCIDSADYDLVLSRSERRRSPAILNSWSLDRSVGPELVQAILERECRLVVQLRHGRQLPSSADERMAWLDDALERLGAAGIEADSLLIDGIMLPWGGDLDAGRGLLDFVGRCAKTMPGLRTLVGLSNASYAQPDPREVDRRWLEALIGCGLSAALLDPLDRRLQSLWRV